MAAAYLSQRTGRAELVRDHSLDLQTKYASNPMLGKTKLLVTEDRKLPVRKARQAVMRVYLV